MNNKIMIVAGEASGDLHGSNLIREIFMRRPDLEIFGVGGDHMHQQGLRLLYHINEMSVLGFVDVLKRFSFFRRVYRELVSAMDKQQPQLLILIDYPGLNLKLARAARQRHIKVLYYIAPQVWAWGANRIPKMKRWIDKMAVIIPFEERLLRKAGIDATFVGHPLLEIVTSKMDRHEFFNTHQLSLHQPVIGLLPGSRPQEINRLLPEMLRTVNQLKSKYPQTQIIVSQAGSVARESYYPYVQNNHGVKFLENCTYEIMKHSDVLLVASGTATLESALFETPLIIVYKVDPISYLIGKQLVKIDSIGLVNVIAERKVVPEFIQHQFVWNNLLPELEDMLFNTQRRDQVISELRQIRARLGSPGASARTADMALELMNTY